MAEVTVAISGRNYRMACDDGQEEHLQKLGLQVDAKIADMKASFGEIGDMRLTVMASVVLADELTEARRQVKSLKEDLDRLRNSDANTLADMEIDEAEAAGVVESVAERLEILAADLNTKMRRLEKAGASVSETLD